jgi:hypothetical protein
MDVQMLRFWGLIVGAGLMAFALWIAALGPEAAPASAETPQAMQIAQAQATPASFLVRFRGSGPIARAQAAAARGQHSTAQARIEAQLRRQTGFTGLCFERFTAGAAEVVLRTCDAVAAREFAQVQAQWLSRLRGMRAVAYADVNATAAPQRAPG